MTALTDIVDQLDGFFGVAQAPADPAFSRFLPATYEGAGRSWRDWMEPQFCTRFNGLMLRGAREVSGVFLAAFPSAVVLDRPGHAGVIAEVAPTTVADLSAALQAVFDIPYLDIAGPDPGVVRRVALVAGAGDRVPEMRNAEALGAQAYITGEIHSRSATDYGRAKFAEVEAFARQTGMALLGVSHAASEFLVMRNEMRAWFKSRVVDAVTPLSEPHWWR